MVGVRRPNGGPDRRACAGPAPFGLRLVSDVGEEIPSVDATGLGMLDWEEGLDGSTPVVAPCWAVGSMLCLCRVATPIRNVAPMMPRARPPARIPEDEEPFLRNTRIFCQSSARFRWVATLGSLFTGGA